jgi:hypothetical protein
MMKKIQKMGRRVGGQRIMEEKAMAEVLEVFSDYI